MEGQGTLGPSRDPPPRLLHPALGHTRGGPQGTYVALLPPLAASISGVPSSGNDTASTGVLAQSPTWGQTSDVPERLPHPHTCRQWLLVSRMVTAARNRMAPTARYRVLGSSRESSLFMVQRLSRPHRRRGVLARVL